VFDISLTNTPFVFFVWFVVSFLLFLISRVVRGYNSLKREESMSETQFTIEVYLETGKKRTIAGAIEWPGWCRSGRSEDEAVRALFAYGPRYARALQPSGIAFAAPADASTLAVVERLKGNATSDYGVPGIAPDADSRPVSEEELLRLQNFLQAAWRTLEETARAAAGKELRLGPRGGGRDLNKIVWHVTESAGGYIAKLAGKLKFSGNESQSEAIEKARTASLDALAAAVHTPLPEHGPRGGAYWTPRYFVRRTAWHILDHAWEIEDRVS
jgi:hypothetical protein